MHWRAIRKPLDAEREHWQFGPIDLVLQAWGEASAVQRTRDNAWRRFEQILPELVAELPALRTGVDEGTIVHGPVARRMLKACKPHDGQFITPMAAVAGAVADEICCFFAIEPGVRKAYVNNGGDIALHAGEGESLTIGVVDHPQKPVQAGDITISADMPVRGLATSGWRGRSFSLGIADSVTVLAANAAAADAAATMIANAVNVEFAGIERAPARELKDDADLGDRLVTVNVPTLPIELVHEALARGQAHTRTCIERGVIVAALLCLQGERVVVGEASASAQWLNPPIPIRQPLRLAA